MGGFPVRARLGYSAAAEVCYVVRHGIFLLVGRVERGRSEAERVEAGRSEPEWPAQNLLHHHGPGGEVLREYSAGVRNRIESARVQESHSTRRTQARKRAGEESQEQYQWRPRAQTGEKL